MLLDPLFYVYNINMLFMFRMWRITQLRLEPPQFSSIFDRPRAGISQLWYHHFDLSKMVVFAIDHAISLSKCIYMKPDILAFSDLMEATLVSVWYTIMSDLLGFCF